MRNKNEANQILRNIGKMIKHANVMKEKQTERPV